MKENTFDLATVQLPILPKVSESSISFVRGAPGAACQERPKIDEIRKHLRGHRRNVKTMLSQCKSVSAISEDKAARDGLHINRVQNTQALPNPNFA